MLYEQNPRLFWYYHSSIHCYDHISPMAIVKVPSVHELEKSNHMFCVLIFPERQYFPKKLSKQPLLGTGVAETKIQPTVYDRHIPLRYPLGSAHVHFLLVYPWKMKGGMGPCWRLWVTSRVSSVCLIFDNDPLAKLIIIFEARLHVESKRFHQIVKTVLPLLLKKWGLVALLKSAYLKTPACWQNGLKILYFFAWERWIN